MVSRSTRSAVPGTAPSTATGPVITWTPGARWSSGIPAQMASMPASIIRSGASPAWWVTASIVRVVPAATFITGGSSGDR